jgi:hypothetical protein
MARSKKKPKAKRPSPPPSATPQSGGDGAPDPGRRAYLLGRASRLFGKDASDAAALSMLDEVWPAEARWSAECLLWMSLNARTTLLDRLHTAVCDTGLPDTFAPSWASVSLVVSQDIVAEVGKAAALPEFWWQEEACIQAALQAIASGRDDVARERLAEIGLRSPFRDVRTLLNGLLAYYRDDSERASRALGMVPHDSLLRPIAERWLGDGPPAVPSDWERLLKKWDGTQLFIDDVTQTLRALHGQVAQPALEGLARIELDYMVHDRDMHGWRIDTLIAAAGLQAEFGTLTQARRSESLQHDHEAAELYERTAQALEAEGGALRTRMAAEARALAVRNLHAIVVQNFEFGILPTDPRSIRVLEQLRSTAARAIDGGADGAWLWLLNFNPPMTDDSGRPEDLPRIARGLQAHPDDGEVCVACMGQAIAAHQSHFLDEWWNVLREKFPESESWGFVYTTLVRSWWWLANGSSSSIDALVEEVRTRKSETASPFERFRWSIVQAGLQRYLGKSDKAAMVEIDSMLPDPWLREALIRAVLLRLLHSRGMELTDNEVTRLRRRWKVPGSAEPSSLTWILAQLADSAVFDPVDTGIDYLSWLLVSAIEHFENPLPAAIEGALDELSAVLTPAMHRALERSGALTPDSMLLSPAAAQAMQFLDDIETNPAHRDLDAGMEGMSLDKREVLMEHLANLLGSDEVFPLPPGNTRRKK